MAKYFLRQKKDGSRVLQATLGRKGQIIHVWSTVIPRGGDLRTAGFEMASSIGRHRKALRNVQVDTGEQRIIWEQ